MSDILDNYRDEFRVRVLGGRPRSILEIGAGNGAFLKSVAGEASKLTGLDPNDEHVSALQAEGFDAVKGTGEALPYADGEFDVVVFSFTPHHMSNWDAALSEAVRVARHSVEILDTWYDDTIADQRTAHEFSRWVKAIDRRSGMVNNDAMTPGELLAPVVTRRDVTYDYVCRRIACPTSIEETLKQGQAYLAKSGNDPELATKFEAIIAAARRDGMSEAGCVQMTIEMRR